MEQGTFSCFKCAEKFSNQGDLVKQYKIHTGGKPADI